MTTQDSMAVATETKALSNVQPISALSQTGSPTRIAEPEDLSPKMVEDIAECLLSTKPSFADKLTGTLKHYAIPFSLASLASAAAIWLPSAGWLVGTFGWLTSPAVVGVLAWRNRESNGRLARVDAMLAELGVPMKARFRITRRLGKLSRKQYGQIHQPAATSRLNVQRALLGSTNGERENSVDPTSALRRLSYPELAMVIAQQHNRFFFWFCVFQVFFSALVVEHMHFAAVWTTFLWANWDSAGRQGGFLSEFGASKAEGKSASRFLRRKIGFFSSARHEKIRAVVDDLYRELHPNDSNAQPELPESFRLHGFEMDGVYEGTIVAGTAIGVEVELAQDCIGCVPPALWGPRAFWNLELGFGKRIGKRITVKIVGFGVDGRPLFSRRAAIEEQKRLPAAAQNAAGDVDS